MSFIQIKISLTAAYRHKVPWLANRTLQRLIHDAQEKILQRVYVPIVNPTILSKFFFDNGFNGHVF